MSIMTNFAEGFDCDSQIEFACCLSIARRSAVEVQALLYTALDAGYISEETFHEHYDQACNTKAMLGGLKHSLSKKKSA